MEISSFLGIKTLFAKNHKFLFISRYIKANYKGNRYMKDIIDIDLGNFQYMMSWRTPQIVYEPPLASSLRQWRRI